MPADDMVVRMKVDLDEASMAEQAKNVENRLNRDQFTGPRFLGDLMPAGRRTRLAEDTHKETKRLADEISKMNKTASKRGRSASVFGGLFSVDPTTSFGAGVMQISAFTSAIKHFVQSLHEEGKRLSRYDKDLSRQRAEIGVAELRRDMTKAQAIKPFEKVANDIEKELIGIQTDFYQFLSNAWKGKSGVHALDRATKYWGEWYTKYLDPDKKKGRDKPHVFDSKRVIGVRQQYDFNENTDAQNFVDKNRRRLSDQKYQDRDMRIPTVNKEHRGTYRDSPTPQIPESESPGALSQRDQEREVRDIAAELVKAYREKDQQAQQTARNQVAASLERMRDDYERTRTGDLAIRSAAQLMAASAERNV